MARRGFFAELHHQGKIAARERERTERERERAIQSAIRREEQARRAEEKIRSQLERAAEVDRKRLDRETREAHLASMEAEVERRNAELERVYEEIDSLLEFTLGVDDYVDLNRLRVTVEHPPFDRPDLEVPIPPPTPIPNPSEPVFSPPEKPSGLRALFGQRSYARKLEEATAEHNRKLAIWRKELERVPLLVERALNEHSLLEARRQASLQIERERFAAECAARELLVAEQNNAVDELVAGLGYGTPEAVQEYISIVLANSVYPPHFEVSHEFSFDPDTAELCLRVRVPEPAKVPGVKAYKYLKASDEIVSTSLSQKACKERYANAVHQVALRSLHEIFEADRRGIVQTISLEVGTEAIDPAIGKRAYVPLVAVGATRECFLDIELSAVVPTATLSRLGASVSKDPFSLVAANALGIRRS
jgi:hypothetical protein